MIIGTKRFLGFTTLKINILVNRAKKGDKNAYGKLYKIYVDQIYRYALYKTGDADLAADITQETFLKAWVKMRNFKNNNGTFKSWVYTIARNKTIDHFRMSSKKMQISENYIDNNQDIEKKMIMKDQVNGVYKAMKKLPPNQKEILILSFINDLTNKEISKITNKNQVALRALKYRALKNLKKELNHE
jgi:RNA polymerase sigma-70 factor (ECF subfamily)